jgi:glycerate dehydrogenase
MSIHSVVLDGHTTDRSADPWSELERFGSVDVYERTPEEHILDRARGAEIVLTNKVPLEAETLEALDDLEFVSVLATGYDVVDLEAARELGIPVSNVPEYATDAVAEHVFGLLLELTHQIGAHDRAVHRGEWTESPDFTFWKTPLVELKGKTLGIVGFGRIGARVVDIGRAFGMSILADERSSRDAPDWEDFQWAPKTEIVEEADVVSLHCPLTDETEGLVDAEMLERMEPSSYLINTARGEVVDEAALAEALEAGEIAGAGVDVASEEPIAADNPLLEAPNCLITPHNAWTTREARDRLKRVTLNNVEAYLEGEPQNVVNELG